MSFRSEFNTKHGVGAANAAFNRSCNCPFVSRRNANKYPIACTRSIELLLVASPPFFSSATLIYSASRIFSDRAASSKTSQKTSSRRKPAFHPPRLRMRNRKSVDRRDVPSTFLSRFDRDSDFNRGAGSVFTFQSRIHRGLLGWASTNIEE